MKFKTIVISIVLSILLLTFDRIAALPILPVNDKGACHNTLKTQSTVSLQQIGAIHIAPNLYTVKINDYDFESTFPEANCNRQKRPNWCWAASTQMLLNYNDIPLRQEHLVNRLFGDQSDTPAYLGQIIELLNRKFPNRTGGLSAVQAVEINPNDIKTLIEFVGARKQPLLVEVPAASMNVPSHVFLLTSLDVQVNLLGQAIGIEAATLMDPWPSNPIERRVDWKKLKSRLTYILGIKVN